jgi:hypothetical protein
MNAQELRIGNYVRNDLSGVEFAVSVDEIRRIYLNHDGGIIEPIKLTVDWLLKFGFKFSAKELGFVKDVKMSHSTNKLIIFPPNNFKLKHNQTSVRFKRIMYVHKLQNLYFELTGQELTIT